MTSRKELFFIGLIKAFHVAVMFLFLQGEKKRQVNLQVIQQHIVLSKGAPAACLKPICFAGNVMNPGMVAHI